MHKFVSEIILWFDLIFIYESFDLRRFVLLHHAKTEILYSNITAAHMDLAYIFWNYLTKGLALKKLKFEFSFPINPKCIK